MAAISVKLQMDSSAFVRTATRALAIGKSLGKSIGSAFSGAVGSAFDKLKFAIPLAGAALAAGTVHAYNFGGEMVDLSARTGIAIDKLVVMKQALADSGVEIDSLVPSLSKMSKALIGAEQGGSAKAFEQIGLHVKDLMALDPADQFERIGKAIAEIQNPTAKLAASMAIFGKSGGQLLSFFSDSSAMDTARDSIGKQASILAKNAEVFDRISDRLGRVFVKIRGFFVGVAASLAPVMDKMTELFDKADLSGFGQKLGEAIKTALSWIVAFWQEPGKVTGYFWEVAKAGALDFGNVLFNIAAKFGEVLAASVLKNTSPIMQAFLGITGGSLAAGLIGDKLNGNAPLGNTDFLGAAAAHARAAGMRPNAALERARGALGMNRTAVQFEDTKTPWRLRGFHGAGQLLDGGPFDKFRSSLQGASMAGYLNQRGSQLSAGMNGTGSLSGFHQGAYGQSPVLSETARRRLVRKNESEAMIFQRHALGNFAAGDTHRLKKIAMEQARKEAGALTDNEALVATANNTKRMADALTEN